MQEQIITKEEINKRNKEEHEWWNKFSEVMAMQWEMSPSLNRILRTAWIKDFFDFLYIKDGLLLDVGCGNGWIAKYFAERGMNTLGVDFSEKQIETANKSIQNDPKLTSDINFICYNVVELSTTEYAGKFDSIIVNAFLHHLTKPEREQVYKNLKLMLKPDGKIYFYEPVVFEKFKQLNKIYFFIYNLITSFLDFFYRGMRVTGMKSAYYTEQQKKGYTGTSPHEAPFSFDEFENNFDANNYEMVVKPFHGFNIGWGSFQVSLKKIPQAFCFLFTPVVYYLEMFFFKFTAWKTITNYKWIMTGIKIKNNN